MNTAPAEPPYVVELNALKEKFKQLYVKDDNGLPSDALPSDALPSDALPSDALPSDALPSDDLPSNNTLPNRGNTLFIFVQQGFENVAKQMQYVLGLGINNDHIFMTTKPQTTSDEMLDCFNKQVGHYVNFNWDAEVVNRSQSHYGQKAVATNEQLLKEVLKFLKDYQKQGIIENILVLDEGGRFLEIFTKWLNEFQEEQEQKSASERRDYRVIAVEHTMSGTHGYNNDNIFFPHILMADCYLKTQIEAQYVAEGVIEASKAALADNVPDDTVFGVIGCGNVGRNVIQLLQEEYDDKCVLVADLSESVMNQAKRDYRDCDNVECLANNLQVFARATIIFGCTGKDITCNLSREQIAGNVSRTTLISASSGDREFQTLLLNSEEYQFEKETYAQNLELDVYQGWGWGLLGYTKKIIIMNGGLPINFSSGRSYGILPEKVGLTLCMKYAAVVQALELFHLYELAQQHPDEQKRTWFSRYVMLDPRLQQIILNNFQLHNPQLNTSLPAGDQLLEKIKQESYGMDPAELHELFFIDLLGKHYQDKGLIPLMFHTGKTLKMEDSFVRLKIKPSGLNSQPQIIQGDKPAQELKGESADLLEEKQCPPEEDILPLTELYKPIQRDHEETEVKRVVIEGDPGMGKTTLADFIGFACFNQSYNDAVVLEVAEEAGASEMKAMEPLGDTELQHVAVAPEGRTMDLLKEVHHWARHFRGVITLKLRDLNHFRSDLTTNDVQEVGKCLEVCQVAEFILKQHDLWDNEKLGQKSADRIKHILQWLNWPSPQEKRQAYLLVLDGCDELTPGMYESNKPSDELTRHYSNAPESFSNQLAVNANMRHRILHLLTDYPYWLMTSRPKRVSTSMMSKAQPERYLTLSGFDPKEVPRYIRAVMSKICERDGVVQSLLTSVSQPSALRELTEIPICCQLICTLWCNWMDIQTRGDITMASLYSKLIIFLTARSLERQQRAADGQVVVACQEDAVYTLRDNDSFAGALRDLEQLAFLKFSENGPDAFVFNEYELSITPLQERLGSNQCCGKLKDILKDQLLSTYESLDVEGKGSLLLGIPNNESLREALDRNEDAQVKQWIETNGEDSKGLLEGAIALASGEIRNSLLKKVVEAFDSQERNEVLVDVVNRFELLKLDSVRREDTIERKYYAFLHLSFQEFLAANHLVRELASDVKGKRQAAITFVIKNKYDPHYRNMLGYASSIVMENGCDLLWGGNETSRNDVKNDFWRGIQEPVNDIQEDDPRHIELIIDLWVQVGNKIKGLLEEEEEDGRGCFNGLQNKFVGIVKNLFSNEGISEEDSSLVSMLDRIPGGHLESCFPKLGKICENKIKEDFANLSRCELFIGVFCIEGQLIESYEAKLLELLEWGDEASKEKAYQCIDMLVRVSENKKIVLPDRINNYLSSLLAYKSVSTLCALGKLSQLLMKGPAKFQEYLFQCLYDGNHRVCEAAWGILAKHAPSAENFREKFNEGLYSFNQMIRCVSLQSLGQLEAKFVLGNAELCQGLISGLFFYEALISSTAINHEQRVAKAASDALMQLGGAAFVARSDELREAILFALQDDGFEMQAMALRIVGSLGWAGFVSDDKRVRDALIAGLSDDSDDSSEMRHAAWQALGRLGVDFVCISDLEVSVLEDGLKDNDQEICKVAWQKLVQLGQAFVLRNEGVKGILTESLQYTRTMRYKFALEAVAQLELDFVLKDAVFNSNFCLFLKDTGNEDNFQASWRALGQLGKKHVGEDLLNALVESFDGDSIVRLNAWNAVGQFGADFVSDKTEVQAKLIKGVKDIQQPWEVRQVIWQVVEQLGVDFIKNKVQNEFLELLGSTCVKEQWMGFKLLGRFERNAMANWPELIKQLKRLRDNERTFVKYKSERALKSIGFSASLATHPNAFHTQPDAMSGRVLSSAAAPSLKI